jgi:drug/metabolite transporter (DMT)-like permease
MSSTESATGDTGVAPLTDAPDASLTSPRPIEARHAVWLLALGLIWGSSYLFIAVLVDEVSPLTTIWVRFALGAAVLGMALIARGGRLPSRAIVWPHLTMMSIFGNVIPFALIAWAQQYTTSALAAVLNATIPFFTLIFATLVFRADQISGAKLAGIGCGFLGVALLTGPSIFNVGSEGGMAELALLVASLCYGFAFAYARRFVRGDPLGNVTAQLMIGFVVVAPFALRFGWVHTSELDAFEIGAWIALSAFGTGLAYIFYYALIRDIGPTRASLVTYIIPVVGVVLGWLLLDEYLGLSGLLGMALIVLGIAVSYEVHRRVLRGRNELA